MWRQGIRFAITNNKNFREKNMNKNTRNALKWIVNILQENNIPFFISGGLAARIYGSERSLYDIDIEVPEKYISMLQPLVKNYVIYGPKKYKDETFDLWLMTLKYEDQEIDIGGIGTGKLFNKKTNQWEDDIVDFSRAVKKEVFGIEVPVINKEDLIEYKNKIRRSTDLQDIEAIKN